MKTMVLPVHSVCFASLTNGFGRDFRQQIVERLAVVLLVEEIDQRLCDHRADALDRRELRLRVRARRDPPKLLDRAEAFQQIPGRDDADVADAEPEQEARPVGLPLRLDRGEQIVDRLLLPALAAEQLVAELVQAEDVGGRMKPAELDEFGDRLLAQALDVERPARYEMPEPLEPLGGADQAARAADVDLALLGDRLALAFGAMVREDIGLADLVARQVLDHLRDHVTGALDADAIADAQAEPLDLVAVVRA